MSTFDQLAQTLEGIAQVRRDEALSRHTTFGVGGPADLFVIVENADQLGEVVHRATEAGEEIFVLGSGSNILVADAGIRGVVIDNRARTTEALEPAGRFRAESGTSFAGFARRLCRQGWAGLAWAVGIPGTLGGAVVYNAGAYGGCLADVLLQVRLLNNATGESRWVDAEELGLVYRGSIFTRGAIRGQTVLEAELELAPGDATALMEEAGSYDERRLNAQPRGRNAGSMFKNPPEKPAWKLIDEVGLRGMRRGDAAVSDKHSNFFVNYGQARGDDVAWLVAEAERRVFEAYGIRLEREVAFVGAWP
ncbi:MAG: UDP-N-acetylmuramate dehydrogenase [Dehalococcoidia bacterium]|nr:UDP-N-acetylmuramate dehydrogenase [Dehalococcoidia bacterium]